MPARFSVSFPKDLLNELERLSELEGTSRSSVLQRAAENYIADRRWMASEGKVAGAALIAYNHEARGIDESLTDVQHEFMDVIVSSLHIHLTREECLLIIAVKGEVKRIKELVEKISRLHGIRTARFCATSLKA